MKKIEWKTGRGIQGDNQVSYIAKSVTYDDYGVCMFVGRETDNPTPFDFLYILLLDIDPAKEVSLSFQKRGRKLVEMAFKVQPYGNGEMELMLPNIITFQNSTDTVNLFQAHINSDVIVFGYTTKDGTMKEFRFSLAGFNETYLEQFI